jgi:hypothetical protein
MTDLLNMQQWKIGLGSILSWFPFLHVDLHNASRNPAYFLDNRHDFKSI